MDTENLVLKPEHPKVGALKPKEQDDKTIKQQIAAQVDSFVLSKEFVAFIKDLWRKCEKLNELEWLRIKQNMIKARKYFDGKQYGRVNDSLEWQDFEKRPGEVNYVSNVYHAHIQTALMELTRGNTNLSFSHIAKDSRRGQLIAQIAEHMYRMHRMQLMSELKMQHENLSLLLNGIAARYTFVELVEDKTSPVKQMMEALLEEMGEENNPLLVCAVCARSNKKNDAVCPNCGSTEFEELEEPKISDVALPSGFNEKQAKVRYVTPDPIGLTFDLHVSDFKDSAFIIWKQVVISDLLKSQYPSIKIQDGIDADELKYQYAASSNTPNVQRLDFFMGERNQKEVAEFCQAWFDPQLYGNVSFKSDIKLMSGVTIPKGTKLKEIFPTGMYVARNGDTILDLWDESKNDKWTVAPYVTRMNTLVGSGTSVALDSQDIINDLTNLKMASIMQDAFSKEFVNSQYLEPENIPNDPTERAVVTNLPDGARIVGNAIDRLPPSPLSSDAYAMDSQVQGMLQAQLGTFSSSASGMPDLKAAQQTYSGMQLMRDITVGRYYPMLAVRADSLDKQQAYQMLLMDQRYMSMKQWARIKGDYGTEAVKAFLECDLREELIINVTPESFMPEMPSQRLAKTMGFAEFIAQNQLDPSTELAGYVADQFNIPNSISGLDSARSIAYGMISKFKEQADAVADNLGDLPSYNVEDPMVAQVAQLVVEAANTPISGLMDDIPAIMDAMKDWWSSDEGRTAPNALRAAIVLRMRELQAETVKESQVAQRMMMESQAPMNEMMAEQAAAEQQSMDENMLTQGMQEMAVEDARIESENARLDQEDARLAQDQAERREQRDHEFRMMQAQEASKQAQSAKPAD
jgi:rubrerythrin